MAGFEIDVSRELYIAAPPGVAVYAQNPAYTSVAGRSLIESVKHEALHFGVGGDRVYYHRRIFRRRSDDNGVTWTELPDQHRESPDTLNGQQRHVSGHVLDERRDRLISMHGTYEIDASEPMFSRGNQRQRTYRMWYEWSADGGRTWAAAKQMIDSRPGFDGAQWAPGVTYGQRGAIADMANVVFLDDGSFVFGLTASNIDVPADMPQPDSEGYSAVIYARGRWNAAGDDIDWRFGDRLIVPPNLSVRGGCEPSVAHLGGERIFVVMRCQGDEARGLYSTRYCCTSDDGGASWGALTTLHYDDGSPVHTPASYAKFFVSSKTGRTYWLANILDHPVHGQTPRYPLAIAEFDTDRCVLVRDSVRIIADRPADAPVERRYSNWGMYEQRDTGDLILTLPEQPRDYDFSAMTRPEQFTADCYRYRVRLTE